jgi:amino acid adenylation domain-containing protein
VPEQIAELRDDNPQSIALSSGDRQMSFEDLDLGADRVAGYLMQLGVEPGGTVAICMERSFDEIVTALGIMRAGAAYVPLDPAWPDSRLRFAVNDSGATVLVARAALLNRLQVKALGIDPRRDAEAIATAPDAVRTPIQTESVAYVIYTSGSTGVPKGVEITTGNLAHLVRWHQNAFGVTRQDRAGHLAGLGFDAAVWEIWPNLCAGATLCLADDAVRSSPALIQQWMIRERVTIGFVPTFHAMPLMAMGWPTTTALRLLLTGGDALQHGPAYRLPFEVVNNYGPTECTVVATSTVLNPGSPEVPSIGRPIDGASVYLLDDEGEQVRDESVGEIYIGGGGVGRGYRNIPDATKRSFLPDPFAGTTSARMYRTGDRGIRRPNGEIEFRGRLDRQTKINGQRVELDEIGIVLSRYPSIEFATVIARTTEHGENPLVAYVLPKENGKVPATRELQRHLQRSLPDYMIPAIFVRLHALPISPNGKLDPAMLPPPTDASLVENKAHKALALTTEEELLGIVRELLENDAILAEDNYFLAGGHSLLGMQLIVRLRNAFGVELSLQQLFESPTPGRLALLVEMMIEATRIAEIWTNLLGHNHIGLDDNFFDMGGNSELVSALQQRIATAIGQSIPIEDLLQSPTVRKQAELAQRMAKVPSQLPPGVLSLQPGRTRNRIFWVHYLSVDLAKMIGEDHSILFVVLTAEDVTSLGKAPTFKSIAACLAGKILATQSKGAYTIGGFCLGGILAYEIASQLKASGHEVSLLVMLDSPHPSFFWSHNSLTPKLTQPRYLAKRVAQLGPRTSLVKLWEHLRKHFPSSKGSEFVSAGTSVAQKMIETAATSYHPEKYEGEVLLLLASDRAPHVNFLPGWQTEVSHGLHTQYIEAHHSELINTRNARSIADAIVSHLASTIGEGPMPCDADIPR